MANTLRFKRGLASGLPTGAAGEPLFTTDTFDLYIGNGTGNTRFQKYIASGSTTQILRGDGSLYTFPLAISSPTNGQVLKYNGTSWVNDSDSGITGSGVAGQVAYFTGATTQGGSNNLFWDNTNNRLGIRTSSPTYILDVESSVVNTIRFKNTVTTSALSSVFHNSGNTGLTILVYGPTYAGGSAFGVGANGVVLSSGAAAPFSIGTGVAQELRFGTSDAVRGRFFANGNFALNSSTDSGQRLQVNGDAFIKGSGNTSATTALTVQNSSGTNMLRVRNDQRIIGNIFNIGTQIGNQISPTAGDGVYNVNGQYLAALFAGFDTSGFGFTVAGFNLETRTVTSGSSGTLNLSHGYAPTSGNGTYTMLQMIGTINQTGGANGITRGLYVNPTLTSAANWRSIEWSNNTGWGLYGAGTANNYLGDNSTLIGVAGTSLVGHNFRINKFITGASTAFNAQFGGQVKSDVTNAIVVDSAMGTQNVAFGLTSLTHFRAIQGTFFNVSAGGSVLNQYGYFVDSTLTGATNNYGFYGNLAASGTSRWNLYMNGTAPNYLNGELLLGSTSNSGEKLQVNGTAKFTSNVSIVSGGNAVFTLNALSTSTAALIFQRSGTEAGRISFSNSDNMIFSSGGSSEKMRLDSSGNLLIGGTLSTGQRLQVFGTSKMIGNNLQLTLETASSTGYASTTYVTASRAYATGVGGDSAAIVNLRDSYYIYDNTASATRLTIDPSGNLAVDTNTLFVDATNNRVGIGTASPQNPLHIYGTSGNQGLIIQSPDANDCILTFGDVSDLSRGEIRYINPSDVMVFKTANLVEAMRITALQNLHIGTFTSDSGERLQVNGTAKITGNTSIGGNLTFPNLKGAVFTQTGGSLLGSISMDSSNQVTIDNNGFFGLSVGTSYNLLGGNTGIGTSTFGTSATRTFAILNGTAPSTSPTDTFQLYSADVTAGNAAPHFRTENGAVIKLYQETTAVGNSTISVGGGNAVLDDTEFDGYTLRQLVRALRNQGILQ